MKNPMSINFAVFNCHVNNANDRAKASFKRQFGEEKFEEIIKPLNENGIMSVFSKTPDIYTMYYISYIHACVNEIDE